MRPAESYVHLGPVAVVPGRVAGLLLRRGGLAEFHRKHRGADPELDAVVLGLKLADLAWRGSVGTDCGSDTDMAGLGPAGCTWLGTRQAARRLGISSRAVRAAISSGRLRARWVGGRHVLDLEDIEHFRAQRAA